MLFVLSSDKMNRLKLNAEAVENPNGTPMPVNDSEEAALDLMMRVNDTSMASVIDQVADTKAEEVRFRLYLVFIGVLAVSAIMQQFGIIVGWMAAVATTILCGAINLARWGIVRRIKKSTYVGFRAASESMKSFAWLIRAGAADAAPKLREGLEMFRHAYQTHNMVVPTSQTLEKSWLKKLDRWLLAEGDNGYSRVTLMEYVSRRLLDQLKYFNNRMKKELKPVEATRNGVLGWLDKATNATPVVGQFGPTLTFLVMLIRHVFTDDTSMMANKERLRSYTSTRDELEKIVRELIEYRNSQLAVAVESLGISAIQMVRFTDTTTTRVWAFRDGGSLYFPTAQNLGEWLQSVGASAETVKTIVNRWELDDESKLNEVAQATEDAMLLQQKDFLEIMGAHKAALVEGFDAKKLGAA